jgi:hypothetical protein
MLVYAFFTNTYLTTNDASRFSLTVSLATGRGGEITRILPRVISPGWKIKDFAVKDRRIYSDKAPLGSLLAVPVFLAASHAGLPPGWVIYFASLFTAGLMTAATALLIYSLATVWRSDERLRVTLALAYGLGSMALFYGTVFFSSAITAFCCFSSFYMFVKMPASARPALHAAAGGFLAGAAILSDYYAAISAVCLLGYGLLSDRKKALPILLGFAIPAAVLLFYNNAVFGAPWPLSYRYANLYSQLHSKGFFGITPPTVKNLPHLLFILFALWGFFFANPAAVISIFAFRRFSLFKREAYMILFMALGYLYLNSSESWFDAYSARFFMPLLPFLFVPLVSVDFKGRLPRNLFFFVIGFSMMINLVGADWFLPEFVGRRIPGMQNLAGLLIGARGLRIGYANFIFLAAAIIPVWLIGKKRKTTVPSQTNL